MLGRKREDQLAAKGAAKKRKWQEESSEDEDDEDAGCVTVEEMEAWKAKMDEEEKQEEMERARKEREAKEEAERQEREYQKRREEEERERREQEEREEREAQERQAERQAERRAEQAANRQWDKGAEEGVSAVNAAPSPTMALLQAQAAGASIAASLRGPPGSQAAATASGGGAEDSTRPSAECVTVHTQIPAARVKDLIGVSGRNVKTIKTKTGVMKLGVMDRNDPAAVEIVGSASSVEKCKAIVDAIAEGDEAVMAVIGNVTETMDIDPRLVSRLIGPKGQNISLMKDQSGAYLAVREPVPGSAPKVVITGFPECVAKGRELVVDFLEKNAMSAAPAAPPPPVPPPARPIFGHSQDQGKDTGYQHYPPVRPDAAQGWSVSGRHVEGDWDVERYAEEQYEKGIDRFSSSHWDANQNAHGKGGSKSLVQPADGDSWSHEPRSAKGAYGKPMESHTFEDRMPTTWQPLDKGAGKGKTNDASRKGSVSYGSTPDNAYGVRENYPMERDDRSSYTGRDGYSGNGTSKGSNSFRSQGSHDYDRDGSSGCGSLARGDSRERLDSARCSYQSYRRDDNHYEQYGRGGGAESRESYPRAAPDYGSEYREEARRDMEDWHDEAYDGNHRTEDSYWSEGALQGQKVSRSSGSVGFGVPDRSRTAYSRPIDSFRRHGDDPYANYRPPQSGWSSDLNGRDQAGGSSHSRGKGFGPVSSRYEEEYSETSDARYNTQTSRYSSSGKGDGSWPAAENRPTSFARIVRNEPAASNRPAHLARTVKHEYENYSGDASHDGNYHGENGTGPARNSYLERYRAPPPGTDGSHRAPERYRAPPPGNDWSHRAPSTASAATRRTSQDDWNDEEAYDHNRQIADNSAYHADYRAPSYSRGLESSYTSPSVYARRRPPEHSLNADRGASYAGESSFVSDRRERVGNYLEGQDSHYSGKGRDGASGYAPPAWKGAGHPQTSQFENWEE